MCGGAFAEANANRAKMIGRHVEGCIVTPADRGAELGGARARRQDGRQRVEVSRVHVTRSNDMEHKSDQVTGFWRDRVHPVAGISFLAT